MLYLSLLVVSPDKKQNKKNCEKLHAIMGSCYDPDCM